VLKVPKKGPTHPEIVFVLSFLVFLSTRETVAKIFYKRTMSGYIASQFKSCLNSVPVPNELMDGIQVLKILQNGKAKLYYLTLSSDRFVIYITPNKLKHGKDNSSTGKGSISKPLMKRVTSIGSNQDDDAENERSVDIGAIDRIQRDQHTFRFENAR
jgi:hypothetical protein